MVFSDFIVSDVNLFPWSDSYQALSSFISSPYFSVVYSSAFITAPFFDYSTSQAFSTSVFLGLPGHYAWSYYFDFSYAACQSWHGHPAWIIHRQGIVRTFVWGRWIFHPKNCGFSWRNLGIFPAFFPKFSVFPLIFKSRIDIFFEVYFLKLFFIFFPIKYFSPVFFGYVWVFIVRFLFWFFLYNFVFIPVFWLFSLIAVFCSLLLPLFFNFLFYFKGLNFFNLFFTEDYFFFGFFLFLMIFIFFNLALPFFGFFKWILFNRQLYVYLYSYIETIYVYFIAVIHCLVYFNLRWGGEYKYWGRKVIKNIRFYKRQLFYYRILRRFFYVSSICLLGFSLYYYRTVRYYFGFFRGQAFYLPFSFMYLSALYLFKWLNTAFTYRAVGSFFIYCFRNLYQFVFFDVNLRFISFFIGRTEAFSWFNEFNEDEWTEVELPTIDEDYMDAYQEPPHFLLNYLAWFRPFFYKSFLRFENLPLKLDFGICRFLLSFVFRLLYFFIFLLCNFLAYIPIMVGFFVYYFLSFKNLFIRVLLDLSKYSLLRLFFSFLKNGFFIFFGLFRGLVCYFSFFGSFLWYFFLVFILFWFFFFRAFFGLFYSILLFIYNHRYLFLVVLIFIYLNPFNFFQSLFYFIYMFLDHFVFPLSDIPTDLWNQWCKIAVFDKKWIWLIHKKYKKMVIFCRRQIILAEVRLKSKKLKSYYVRWRLKRSIKRNRFKQLWAVLCRSIPDFVWYAWRIRYMLLLAYLEWFVYYAPFSYVARYLSSFEKLHIFPKGTTRMWIYLVFRLFSFYDFVSRTFWIVFDLIYYFLYCIVSSFSYVFYFSLNFLYMTLNFLTFVPFFNELKDDIDSGNFYWFSYYCFFDFFYSWEVFFDFCLLSIKYIFFSGYFFMFFLCDYFSLLFLYFFYLWNSFFSSNLDLNVFSDLDFSNIKADLTFYSFFYNGLLDFRYINCLPFGLPFANFLLDAGFTNLAVRDIAFMHLKLQHFLVQHFSKNLPNGRYVYRYRLPWMKRLLMADKKAVYHSWVFPQIVGGFDDYRLHFINYAYPGPAGLYGLWDTTKISNRWFRTIDRKAMTWEPFWWFQDKKSTTYLYDNAEYGSRWGASWVDFQGFFRRNHLKLFGGWHLIVIFLFPLIFVCLGSFLSKDFSNLFLRFPVLEFPGYTWTRFRDVDPLILSDALSYVHLTDVNLYLHYRYLKNVRDRKLVFWNTDVVNKRRDMREFAIPIVSWDECVFPGMLLDVSGLKYKNEDIYKASNRLLNKYYTFEDRFKTMAAMKRFVDFKEPWRFWNFLLIGRENFVDMPPHVFYVYDPSKDMFVKEKIELTTKLLEKREEPGIYYYLERLRLYFRPLLGDSLYEYLKFQPSEEHIEFWPFFYSDFFKNYYDLNSIDRDISPVDFTNVFIQYILAYQRKFTKDFSAGFLNPSVRTVFELHEDIELISAEINDACVSTNECVDLFVNFFSKLDKMFFFNKLPNFCLHHTAEAFRLNYFWKNDISVIQNFLSDNNLSALPRQAFKYKYSEDSGRDIKRASTRRYSEKGYFANWDYFFVLFNWFFFFMAVFLWHALWFRIFGSRANIRKRFYSYWVELRFYWRALFNNFELSHYLADYWTYDSIHRRALKWDFNRPRESRKNSPIAHFKRQRWHMHYHDLFDYSFYGKEFYELDNHSILGSVWLCKIYCRYIEPWLPQFHASSYDYFNCLTWFYYVWLIFTVNHFIVKAKLGKSALPIYSKTGRDLSFRNLSRLYVYFYFKDFLRKGSLFFK